MSKICLMAEKVGLPPLNEEVLARWIEAVAHTHDRVVGKLTYIFCNDDFILATNQQFLQHDYYTDIITFDYSNSRRISGDMVISLDTVESNAAMLNRDSSEELLHLCGINDKGPGEREIMERHENEALSIVPIGIFSYD